MNCTPKIPLRHQSGPDRKETAPPPCSTVWTGYAKGEGRKQLPGPSFFDLVVAKGSRRRPVAFREVFKYNFQEVKTTKVITL